MCRRLYCFALSILVLVVGCERVDPAREATKETGGRERAPSASVPPLSGTSPTVPPAAPAPAPTSPFSGETGSPLDWNEKRALELVALPLSCLDRPHARPGGQAYLYEATPDLRANYERSLAFYGCFDWHSAVNSTWAIVKVLASFPDSAVASLIREKLDNHLSKSSLEGELLYFKNVARPGFERPYGWAWLMKLYVELARMPDDDPDAARWAENLRPLAELFAERTVEYLDHLSHPIRVGTHNNTAFSLELMLEYAREVGDERLASAIERRAAEFFENDTTCPVTYEPSGSDFLSPCLSEAVLMSRVLAPDREIFSDWLDRFLADDEPLGERVTVEDHYLPDLTVSDDEEEQGSQTDDAAEDEPQTDDDAEADTLDDERRAQERRLAGARSHLIGLAFVRGAALVRLAEALPSDDPRARSFREMAAVQAAHGFETMYDAQYFGSHWLASFAVRMLTSTTEAP